eukprot:9019550-Pyramimonas_sp.AAC.1
MEGGMAVQALNWDIWRQEREDAEVHEDDDDPESAELAKGDMKTLRKYVLLAPKRRAVPQGTCPLELFHVLLFP